MLSGTDGRRRLSRRDAGPPGAALLTAGLAGARVVPAAAAGVFGGRVAGRGRPESVLLGALLGQLLAIAAVSCALFAGAPFGVVLALAAVDAVVSVAYRPRTW